MHQIVPVVGLLVVGLSGRLALLVDGGSAISAEAHVVRSAATEVAESTERSVSLFGKKAEAIAQLDDIVTEHVTNARDDDDAVRVSPTTVGLAKQFIRVLPEDFPLPEFDLEPDGEISLEWSQSRNRVVSLSIGATDRVPYAWLEGAESGHGVASFDGRNVPRSVLDAIERIVGRHAGFWAA